jgi:hypothetical protein
LTQQKNRPFLREYFVVTWALALVTILVGGCHSTPKEAPEAEKILAVQSGMPFQILIPAFLPREFEREKVNVAIDDSGPGAEPMVQLTYSTTQGAVLFIREWVPVNPDLEVLSASRPIETKWGKGWLLLEGEDLAVIWVDVGPLRVSIYTRFLDLIKKEKILQMAETLGPASNRQIFTYVVGNPTIKEMAPPPPVEIKTNAEGVQELTLVITPGGYSPIRFAVKKGVPVRLIFRQLGEVGCGNEMIFPSDPNNPVSLTLDNPGDTKVLEFTPQQTGDFQFFCSHQMYRGVMTVYE